MQSNTIITSIVEKFRLLFPFNNINNPLQLHEPIMEGNEWKYVKECIDTGWVSSAGSYVDEFENMLSEFTGVKYAVATVNGTSALHISLLAVGVKKDNEVIIPTLSFVATANAVIYCNAIPVFADCNELTLGIDSKKLDYFLAHNAIIINGVCVNANTGRQIKALVVMHTFGHPGDLDEIKQICAKWSISLVEDAAEALGSTYKGRHVGHFGKISALSFNGNKIITTGGGGAILTNDEELYLFAKHITTTAKVKHKWTFDHDQVGYNYRLPNINAALGCAQLEKIDIFLKNKRRLAQKYEEAFMSIPEISFFKEGVDRKSNYWLNAILLKNENAPILNELIDNLNSSGFFVRPAWKLLHRLPMYQGMPKMDLSISENLESRIINIPSSANLKF